MKYLTLIRHAKSSWDEANLPDHARPLNKRGRHDAPMMGQRMAEKGLEPDVIVSSPAMRAISTAEAIAEELGYSPTDIVTDQRLYGADEAGWLAILRGLDDGLEHVMIVGHNPGLTEVANTLSPDPIGNVPTCGVVEFEFDAHTWADVGGVRPKRVKFDYPKS
ncbi:MAG: histidine phosphatase family protein [Thermoflexales bacterium]|nr:histidine phosphatase family protein [Thermoflexales bacterium]